MKTVLDVCYNIKTEQYLDIYLPESEEFAVVLYRDKLPKFNNTDANGERHMIFNWFEWKRDSQKEYPKIHPTQKPVSVLKRLIEIFTDPGDVVIDPCAGSGSTLRAAAELRRNVYGFEVSTKFYNEAKEKMLDGHLTKCSEGVIE